MSDEATNTSNVVGINGKKRGPKPKDGEPSDNAGEEPPKPPEEKVEKPPKLLAGQIEHDLVAVLAREPITDITPFPLNQVPLFPRQYDAFRTKLKDDVCLAEVNDNTAVLTTKENIASDLADFCGGLSGVCSPYNVTIAKTDSVVRRWTYKRRDLKPIPPPWGFKSSPELCFNRLPYDPIERDDWDLSLSIFAPTFEAMCRRVRNTEAFEAMIGSIFYLKASRKQVLWLHGPTGGGKSQLSCLLCALMGTAAVSFENDDFDGQFWKADLLDKRTAYIDEGDPNFLQSNTFKALTGRRGKRINQKFLRAFEANINTILFASSNPPPEIPNDPSIISRVVPCYVEPLAASAKIPELDVEENFRREAGYIAGYCMSVYRRVCPTFGAVPFDISVHLQPAIDNFEIDFLEFFDHNFVHDVNKWIYANDFNNRLSAGGMLGKKTEFTKFMRQRYPAIYYKNKTAGKKAWFGLQIR